MWRAARRLQRPEEADTPRRWAEGQSLWLASAKLKLVDGCNLRCFMCNYWHRRRKDELSEAEVVAVLGDLAALGCEKLHLTGGELYMRRDTNRLVAHATSLGMRVNLTTNGTLIDKAQIKELVKIPARSVTVSLDAPTARVHDAIRGRPGAWKKTVRTLDQLLARRGPKTKVRLNTVVSRRNLHTLTGWADFLRERPIDGWLLIPMDEAGEDTDHLTEADIAWYTAAIAPLLADRVSVPGFDPWLYGRTGADRAHAAEGRFARGYYVQQRCFAPWVHTLVGPTGDVYPCCQLHRRIPPLGNVRQAPLRDIFHADPYVTLRLALGAERLPWCHRCADFLEENAAIAREVAWPGS